MYSQIYIYVDHQSAYTPFPLWGFWALYPLFVVDCYNR